MLWGFISTYVGQLLEEALLRASIQCCKTKLKQYAKARVGTCSLGVASLGSHKVKNTMPRECIHVIYFTRVRNLWHAGPRLGAPRLQPAFLRAAAAPFRVDTYLQQKGPPGQRHSRPGPGSEAHSLERSLIPRRPNCFFCASPGSRGHDLEDDGQPNQERILAFVCGRRICKDRGMVEERAQRSPGTSRSREPLAADSG